MTNRFPIPTVAFAAALALGAAAPATLAAQAPAAAPAAAAPAGQHAAAPAAQPAAAAPAAPQPFDADKLADQALHHVRARLKLTEDQMVRIKPLLADTMTKLRQTLIDYSSPDGVMFPALVQEFRDTREKFRGSLEPILSPDQMKAFMVIRHETDQQLRATICDARLAEIKPRLSLRPDQELPVRTILCQDFESKRDLVAGMTTSTGGPATGRPATPLFQKIQDDTEARLKQVLAPEQMKAYETYRDALKAKAEQPAS
ncbi:MAG TPA: hypothetical protein VFB49_01655 [Patescibacteria group bacterium]|nr:hypothetical protein [Patescibacteria group bacterium]